MNRFNKCRAALRILTDFARDVADALVLASLVVRPTVDLGSEVLAPFGPLLRADSAAAFASVLLRLRSRGSHVSRLGGRAALGDARRTPRIAHAQLLDVNRQG